MNQPQGRKLAIIGLLTAIVAVTAVVAVASQSTDDADLASVNSTTTYPASTETTLASSTSTSPPAQPPATTTGLNQLREDRSFNFDPRKHDGFSEVALAQDVVLVDHQCLDENCERMIATTNDNNTWKLWLTGASANGQHFFIDSELVVGPVLASQKLHAGQIYETTSDGSVVSCTPQLAGLYDANTLNVLRAWAFDGKSLVERKSTKNLDIRESCG